MVHSQKMFAVSILSEFYFIYQEYSQEMSCGQ